MPELQAIELGTWGAPAEEKTLSALVFLRWSDWVRAGTRLSGLGEEN